MIIDTRHCESLADLKLAVEELEASIFPRRADECLLRSPISLIVTEDALSDGSTAYNLHVREIDYQELGKGVGPQMGKAFAR